MICEVQDVNVVRLTFGQHQLEGKLVTLKSPLAILDAPIGSKSGADPLHTVVSERKVRLFLNSCCLSAVSAFQLFLFKFLMTMKSAQLMAGFNDTMFTDFHSFLFRRVASVSPAAAAADCHFTQSEMMGGAACRS